MSVIQQFRQQARFGERMGGPVVHTIWRGCKPCASTVFCASAAESVFIAHSLWIVDAVCFSASGTIEVGVLYAFISYLGDLTNP